MEDIEDFTSVHARIQNYFYKDSLKKGLKHNSNWDDYHIANAERVTSLTSESKVFLRLNQIYYFIYFFQELSSCMY